MSPRSSLAALARDRFVQTFAIVLVLAWSPYLVPFLEPSQLEAYARSWLDFPLLLMAIAAFLLGLRKIESRLERGFWRLLATAWCFWVIARVLNLVVSDEVYSDSRFALFHDLLFVAFYLFTAIALERRPHQRSRTDLERRLDLVEASSVIVFAFALLVYFVAVPSALVPADYPNWVPSLFLYAGLDLYLLTRILLLRSACRDARWRTIYGALVLMAGAFAATDLLEACTYTGFLAEVEYGTLPDLLWTLPFVFAVAAARLRTLRFPAADVGESTGTGQLLFERMRDSPVLLCLVALPTIHLLSELSGQLDPELSRARSGTAFVGALVLGALAFMYSRALRRGNRQLEQESGAIKERLQLSSRMEAIGRLAGGVAHDINNLVHIVGACSDMLLQESDRESDTWRHANEIKKAARRAQELSARLKSIEQADESSADALDLNEAIRNVESTLRSAAGNRVALVTRLEASPIPVYVDRSGLERALLNLVINARDALPSGGEVQLTSSLLDSQADSIEESGPTGHALIMIRDHGIGMDESTLARAFDPYFTTKERGKGTGLGLSIVYRFVTGAGGRVDVESEPGLGTTIRILLPLAAETEPQPEERQVEWIPQAPPLQSSSAMAVSTGVGPERPFVLVVDDEAAVRTMVVRLLQHNGHEALAASGGPEALERIQSRRVDLLLTDVVMPDLRGPELAARARELQPGLAVLYMSGHAHTERDCQPLLSKPFTSRQLAEAVRASLLQSV